MVPSRHHPATIPLLPATISLSSRYHPAPIPPPPWYLLVTTRYNPVLHVLIPLPIASIQLQSRSNPTTITVCPTVADAINKNEPDSVEVRQTTTDTVFRGHHSTSQLGRPWYNHDDTRYNQDGTRLDHDGTRWEHDGTQSQRQTERFRQRRFSSRHDDNHWCPMYPPGGGLVGSVGLDRGERQLLLCVRACVRGVYAGVCRMCEL